MVRFIFMLLVTLGVQASEVLTFSQLTELASHDIGKNIFLDKSIPEYKVEINLVDHAKEGQMFQFYKVVLFDHNLTLKYDIMGEFYSIKSKSKQPTPPALIHKDLKLHYYSYKIKNITNTDIIDAMSIFPNIKYKYLKQSDMIVYSATRIQHAKIKKILLATDNNVKSSTIKITLFTFHKSKVKEYGSSLEVFKFGSGVDTIFKALTTGASASFSVEGNYLLDFSLKALEAHGLVDVYQEPTMLLTNGIETVIDSVVNVAYKSSTITTQDDKGVARDQLSYRDIGLRINVLPKIKNDFVYLNLNLISEELLSLENDKPFTQKITYKNSVKLKKGKPILLTGIKKVSKHYERDGVVLLSDIPLIGNLFKKESKHQEEQNMNILIEVL